MSRPTSCGGAIKARAEGRYLGLGLRYDAGGHLINDSFSTYLIPQAADMPKIEVGHLESPSPLTSLGTKGCGEGGPVGVPAAVMNAVEDALSPWKVVLSETPLTPARMLSLIQAAKGKRRE